MNSDQVAHWVAIVKDAVTGIAAGVAAVVAAMGLTTWRRQIHGNTNYELSRRLLRSAYKLREAIRWVHAPFMSSGEKAAAMKAYGLEESSQKVFDDRGEQLAYQARWNKVVKAQVEFAAEVLRLKSYGVR